MSAIQSDLWSSIPPPHVRGSETSAAAADSVRVTAESQRGRIYDLLLFHGAKSREEIGQLLDIGGDSVRPRVRELMKLKLIEVAPRTTVTTKGRAAELLRAVI